MIQHRDYARTRAPSRINWFDDAIEFTNPGGPYGLASAAEFGELSDDRNPSLTAELTRLGYVQQLGRGVRRARALLTRHGNPPLVVDTDGDTTLVVKARNL